MAGKYSVNYFELGTQTSIELMAERLIDYAQKCGFVVTIERESLQPLAMGHAKSVINVRPVFERAEA